MEYSGVQRRSSSVFTDAFTTSPPPPPDDSHQISGSGTSGATSEQESSMSDCDSGVTSGASSDDRQVFDIGLVKLAEGDRVHDLIKQRFIASLGFLGAHSTVVAINRNPHSGLTGQARLRAFQIYLKAVEEKCGGNANVKYAWYSPSSKAEISTIVGHGFGHSEKPNGVYGRGVYLAPDDFPLEW